MKSTRLKIETVALIAGIVSIILAFFAIWQANHHRDQSDKLNRDTTEKLARIEAFATSTKEDAFAEIKRWGDFARAGGKAWAEANTLKEQEIQKLKEEIQSAATAEINKVLRTVESKIGSSATTSTISEIKREFEKLKKEILKIQDKTVARTKELEKMSRILATLRSLSPEDQGILRALAKQPDWIDPADLTGPEFPSPRTLCLVNELHCKGLLEERTLDLPTGEQALLRFKLDKDLKEALLR